MKIGETWIDAVTRREMVMTEDGPKPTGRIVREVTARLAASDTIALGAPALPTASRPPFRVA